MLRRLAEIVLTPLVRGVEWLFGPRAPGLDLWLGLFSTGWAALMIFNPKVFDRGPLVGMAWLPDLVWTGVFVVLALLHWIGLVRPAALSLRQTSCLASAWVWISVSFSIATIEITTGVVTYAILGSSGMAGALYLSGQPRKVA